MLPSYRIEFVSNSNGSKVGLTVYSHYTCIYGEASGEGKTFFLDYIRDGRNTGEIDVVVPSGYGFAIADVGSIDLALNNTNPFVIMIDEVAALRDDVICKLNESKHIIICVARSMPFRMDYPLKGMYKVIFNEDSFDIQVVDSLSLANNFDCAYDEIIVESTKDTSEHQLLSRYLPNVKAVGGRDRLQKYLRDTSKRYLVFADLSNIGRSYQILMKRCRDSEGKMVFYDYLCFEELLYSSDLVQSLGKVNESSVFDFITIERYYEHLLEVSTLGTDLRYLHGRPLSSRFLDKSNFDKVFNSNVAKGIKEYILKHGDCTIC